MRKSVKTIIGLLLTVIFIFTDALTVAYAATTTGNVPITTYTLSGRVTTYKSVNGSYSGYIDSTDQCKILAVYDSGWLRVRYPVSWGYKTAYARSNNFFINVNFDTSTTTLGKTMTVYRGFDLASSIGTVYADDGVIIVGNNGTNTQVIYPVSGGYKMGWINASSVIY